VITFDEIRRATMIGAGTMGSGMGLCFSQAGYDVTLYDVEAEQLDRALRRIANSQAVFVQEGLITDQEAQAARERISATNDLEVALAHVDYVLEAAPEDLALKQDLFQTMEELVSPEVILATNTSGLSITEIASVCDVPERVGGMHWANPPEIVPLVEVIRGQRTSDHTVDLIYRVAEKLGKVPVMVKKDVPGFASNRLQFALLREALHLVAAGVVSPEGVDRTLKNGVGFRYPWLGPLETADLGGLDVFHSVAQYLLPALSNMTSTPDFFDDLVEEGKLGIKSGEGFYDYETVSREETLRQRDLYFIRQLKLLRDMQKQAE
jgi:3-hydroxybutyryl-CoA dehydrogenase